jgi:hypothetical protein
MYARDGMVPDAEHLRGSGEPEFWVRFTDHEAAIEELQQMRRTLHSNLEYKDARIAELEADREQVLADAKARIGRLAAPNGSYGEAEWGFLRGVTAALAALTQPQTEKCPQCGGDGKGPLTHHFGEPCPTCDGGGAATAAGVADADLVRVGDFFGIPAFTHPDVKPGIVGIVSAGEVTAVIADREEPSPYAKAFREKFPVPEFPGIKNRQEDQA